MKKIQIKTTCFAILLCISLHAQSFEWQNPKPHGDMINCIRVVGKDTVVAVTRGGLFQKSTDGGITWDIKDFSDLELNSIAVIDAQHIWVAGKTDCIYFTSDLGEGWTLQHLNTDPYNDEHNLVSISFIDQATGVTSGFGAVLRTTDGGSSWYDIKPKVAKGIAGSFLLPNGSIVVLSSSFLYTTNDGGMNWTQTDLPGMNIRKVLCYDTFLYVLYGANGTIYVTEDAGQSWSDRGVYLKSDVSDLILLRDSRTIVFSTSGNVLCYVSTDLGQKWLYGYRNDKHQWTGSTASSVTYDSHTQTLYLAGSSGRIEKALHTINMQWSQLSGWTNIESVGNFIMYNDGHGIAVFNTTQGAYGVSSDRGQTWRSYTDQNVFIQLAWNL